MIETPETVRTESAADLRLVLDALALGVVALDAEGVVRVANRAAAAALAAGDGEPVGERLGTLLPEYVAPADPGASARVLRRGAGGEARALLVAERTLAESASSLRRL